MLTLDIGLDVDDVLFPWSKQAHAACEVAGITNGKVITQWGMHLDYGVPVETLWDVLHAAYRNGMLLSAEPMRYVRDQLLRLRGEGYRVHLVTARGCEGPMAEQVRKDTVTWLEESDLTFDTLTFTKDKTTVPTDYFLDDSITNVTALRAAGVEAYLHHQNHNAAAPISLPRVTDIRQFVNVVLGEASVMAECK